MMEVRGVFKSWETLEISWVFMFWLFTSSSTAILKPSLILFRFLAKGVSMPTSSGREIAKFPRASWLLAR